MENNKPLCSTPTRRSQTAGTVTFQAVKQFVQVCHIKVVANKANMNTYQLQKSGHLCYVDTLGLKTEWRIC